MAPLDIRYHEFFLGIVHVEIFLSTLPGVRNELQQI